MKQRTRILDIGNAWSIKRYQDHCNTQDGVGKKQDQERKKDRSDTRNITQWQMGMGMMLIYLLHIVERVIICAKYLLF